MTEYSVIGQSIINVAKTKQMHFFFHQDSNWNIGTYNPNIQYGMPLKINGRKIERVNQFNFLGIQIMSTLSWKVHTDLICSKLSKNVGMLHQLKNRVPFQTLKMLYNTLIQSYLNHGILTWGYSPGRVGTLQNKAVRAITRARYNAHAEPIFKRLKVLRVNEILTQRGLKFYYWLKNNEVPLYFQDMFRTGIANHGHNTRGSQNIQALNSRTVGATKCLRYLIPDHIEKVDKCVLEKVKTHSPDGFANYAKQFLLSNYSETPCLDTPGNEVCEECLRLKRLL